MDRRRSYARGSPLDGLPWSGLGRGWKRNVCLKTARTRRRTLARMRGLFSTTSSRSSTLDTRDCLPSNACPRATHTTGRLRLSLGFQHTSIAYHHLKTVRNPCVALRAPGRRSGGSERHLVCCVPSWPGQPSSGWATRENRQRVREHRPVFPDRRQAEHEPIGPFQWPES